MTANTFEQRVIEVIKMMPRGRVASYGQVAAMAGNARGARQVVRVLHASSRNEQLPWFRVVNRHGGISLPKGGGYEVQKALLQGEGVKFDAEGRIDMARFQWDPGHQVLPRQDQSAQLP